MNNEILQFLKDSDLESKDGCTCNNENCVYYDEISSIILGEFYYDMGANLTLYQGVNAYLTIVPPESNEIINVSIDNYDNQVE